MQERQGSHLVVFFNKIDKVDDWDLFEQAENQVRDLLVEYEFPGREIPILNGSALKALQASGIQNPGEDYWVDRIYELVDALDQYIPNPE